jgi:hypothetical protein
MRGLVYIIPVFYLLIAMGFEKIINSFANIGKIVLVVSIGFTITLYTIIDVKLIIPKDHPIFPRELGYLEFEKMYDYIRTNLNDVTLVNISYILLSSSFYEVEIDYFLDTAGELKDHYTTFLGNDGVRRSYYINTTIIEQEEEFKVLLDESPDIRVCLITQSFSNRFLTASTQEFIKQNFTSEAKFISLEILCSNSIK